MKKMLAVSAFSVLLLSTSALAQGPSVAGSWDMSIESPQGKRDVLLVIKKEGDKLSGALKGPNGERPIDSIELKGSDITIKMTAKIQGQDMIFTYTGKVDKDSMKGDADFGGFASGSWSAVPHKEGAAAPAGGGSSQPSGATNITGTWDFQVETAGGTGTPVFTFKQDGENLTGHYKGQLGEAPVTGTVKGTDAKFTIKVNFQGQDLTIVYNGKVDGNSMKGTAALGDLGEATFTAKKRQ
ncbi:MAG TPA: hypothetical protein VKM94_14680 [Blastocatellia bacterium]|nr:hypothetical protein [Blastocatellia bacterium]